MSTIPQSPRFYVYTLARPDGSVFYVGKGSGDRLSEHKREARRGHRCHKCNVIRKIWQVGGDVQIAVIFTTDDETEAYAHEAQTIARYGLDALSNHSIGGKGGATGAVRSLETRAKQSAAHKQMWKDPDYRARMTERSKAALSAPEIKAQKSAIQKAVLNNPETRARQSAASKARMNDPVIRGKVIAGIKARRADPVAKAKASAFKKAWCIAHPECAALSSERMKARYADPESRARLVAAIKAGQARKKAEAENHDVDKKKQ